MRHYILQEFLNDFSYEFTAIAGSYDELHPPNTMELLNM